MHHRNTGVFNLLIRLYATSDLVLQLHLVLFGKEADYYTYMENRGAYMKKEIERNKYD
jgi:hypothetical protein